MHGAAAGARGAAAAAGAARGRRVGRAVPASGPLRLPLRRPARARDVAAGARVPDERAVPVPSRAAAPSCGGAGSTSIRSTSRDDEDDALARVADLARAGRPVRRCCERAVDARARRPGTRSCAAISRPTSPRVAVDGAARTRPSSCSTRRCSPISTATDARRSARQLAQLAASRPTVWVSNEGPGVCVEHRAAARAGAVRARPRRCRARAHRPARRHGRLAVMTPFAGCAARRGRARTDRAAARSCSTCRIAASPRPAASRAGSRRPTCTTSRTTAATPRASSRSTPTPARCARSSGCRGAANHDWEDLAVAPDAARHSVGLAGRHRRQRRDRAARCSSTVSTSRASRREHAAVTLTANAADVWRLRYPSGPANAESLAVTPTGRAYVFTKNADRRRGGVRGAAAARRRTACRPLRRIGTLPIPPLATGAAISRGRLAARRPHLLRGLPVAAARRRRRGGGRDEADRGDRCRCSGRARASASRTGGSSSTPRESTRRCGACRCRRRSTHRQPRRRRMQRRPRRAASSPSPSTDPAGAVVELDAYVRCSPRSR